MDFKQQLSLNHDIYLFEWAQQQSHNQSRPNDFKEAKIHDFISLLKFFKIMRPYKFSAICNETGLISDLTLKENILLNSNTDSLTSKKDFQFEELINKQKNPYLLPLIEKFVEADLLPKEANNESRKCAQIIKAILSDSQFFFMESPEKELSFQTFNLILKALKHHAKNQQVNIFISSPNPELWFSEAKFVVRKNLQQGFFIEAIQPLNNLSPIENLENDNELKFIIPEKNKKEVA